MEGGGENKKEWGGGEGKGREKKKRNGGVGREYLEDEDASGGRLRLSRCRPRRVVSDQFP